MDLLPPFLNREQAVALYQQTEEKTDAFKAYTVSYLSRQGMNNREIRARLAIEKVYTVTHLKRAGLLLNCDELNLWHRNPKRITLGHVRALGRFGAERRTEALRNLLLRNTPSHQLRRLAKGAPAEKSADIKQYETLMSEVIGRPIEIQYDASKQSGELIVKFFSLGELDDLSTQLGFNAEDHFN